MEELLQWANSPLWDNEISKNEYIFPLQLTPEEAKKEGNQLAQGIPSTEIIKIGNFICTTSPQSHTGPFKWAIDFLVPDGSIVYAARAGILIEMREDSETWGPTFEYKDYLNYLTLQHDNDEYSQYCHLAKNSVSNSGLQLGSIVKQDQQIARVGKTGWTDRDHLHFIVFRGVQNVSPFRFKSLKIKFK